MIESSPPPAQIWTGSGSDNLWTTPENWSLGTVPQAGASLEISNGDTIDITGDTILPSLSTIALLNGELSIDSGAHLKLEDDSLLKIDGGSITRDLLVDTGNVNIGVNGTDSVLDVCSGSIQFTNGVATNVTFVYSDMVISGGDIDLISQTRLYGGLTVIGSDATIDVGRLTAFSGSTIHFELDEAGVSPINVDVWLSISNTSIWIDGSSYTGGSATIPLLSAANLLNQSSSITVTGLENRGYIVEVEQNQATDEVNLIITEGTTDTDSDGYLDWEEAVMGTDPTDPSSTVMIDLQPTNTGLSLSWPTVSGRTGRAKFCL